MDLTGQCAITFNLNVITLLPFVLASIEQEHSFSDLPYRLGWLMPGTV